MKLLTFKNKNLVRFEADQYEFEGDLKTLQEMFELINPVEIGIILDKKNKIVQISTKATIYVVCNRRENEPYFLTNYNSNVIRFINNEVNMIDNWIVETWRGDININKQPLKTFK